MLQIFRVVRTSMANCHDTTMACKCNVKNMSSQNRFLQLNNGKRMPIIGLGTWQTTDEEMEDALNCALKAGYRHFDTAYNYRNEAVIGKVLRQWLDTKKVKREELFIVTKLPMIGNHAESVEKYLKKSLEALQLDYVDLYLIHHPVGLKDLGNDDILPKNECNKLLLDCTTDLISLWKGMERQVDVGRTISIGLSNFNASQIMRIVKSCRIKPVNLQIELNVYLQQRELVAFCKALEITVCAFSPIGSPGFAELLKKSGAATPSQLSSPLEESCVKIIAEAHHKTPAQILLRHIIERGIAVIPKSKTPERILQNYQIFDFTLTNEETDDLNSLDKGRRMFIGGMFTGMEDHPEYPLNEAY